VLEDSISSETNKESLIDPIIEIPDNNNLLSNRKNGKSNPKSLLVDKSITNKNKLADTQGNAVKTKKRGGYEVNSQRIRTKTE
jgi:hypothetical protein